MSAPASNSALVGPLNSDANGDALVGTNTDFIIAESGAPGWRDLIGQINVRPTGAAVPTWTQIGATPFWAYLFALNDDCWLFYHIDHDYAPGTPFYPHVHFITNGTNVQPVKFDLTYTIAKGHNQSNFNMAGTVVSVTQTPNGTAFRHYVAEYAPGISSAELEPDSIIWLRVVRVTNGGTDNTDGVFVMTADCHYQASRLSTKNKAPNFYT